MKMMVEEIMQKGNKTGLAMAGAGLFIAGVGRVVGGTMGAGITGFGLAHVAMGMMDMFKPLVKN